MKKRIYLSLFAFALSLVAFGVSAVSTAPVLLFSDSFEKGNFNNWTTADKGGNKWSVLPGILIKAQDGKKDAEISRILKKPVTDWKLTKNISTVGYDNLSLSFYYLVPKLGHLEANDHFVAEYFDGTAWQKVGDITNTDTGKSWQLASYFLPVGANNNANFAFRLRAQFNPADRGLDALDTVIIDNVKLVGSKIVPIAQYSITVTQGVNGTISPDTASIVSGDSQTFTIIPATGFQIANLIVDGEIAVATSTYTFSNVIASHTFSAVFSPIPSIANFAYVPRFNSNDVRKIDLETGAIVASAMVGLGPNNVAISLASRRLFVTNFAGKSISVLRLNDLSLIDTWYLPSEPVGISVSGDGSRIFVAHNRSGGNSLSVFDTSTGNIVGAIDVGKHPMGTVLSRSGQRLYVVSRYNDPNGVIDSWNGSVKVVDLSLMSVIADIPAGFDPLNITMNELGTRVYVVGDGQTVYEIDTNSNTVVSTIGAGLSPSGIAVDKGNIYVLNRRDSYSDCCNSSVSVISEATHNLEQTWVVSEGSVGINVSGDKVVIPGINLQIRSRLDGSLLYSLPSSNAYMTGQFIGPETSEPPIPQEKYTVIVTQGANGTISPGTTSFVSGSSQTFTIEPATGYQIKNLIVDGLEVTATSSYSFTNITASHSLSAVFIPFDPATELIPKFVLKWGSLGTGDGQFNRPVNVAVDSVGNVYVMDSGWHDDYRNYRVQKFDSSGNYITKWGVAGVLSGRLVGAQGIAIDKNDNVYVGTLEWDAYPRIQKYDSNGNFLKTIGNPVTGLERSGGSVTYFYITVDQDGNLYVADAAMDKILKYNSSGSLLSSFGTSGSSDGQFNAPRGVVLDTEGNIYVADAGNSRVQKFDSNGNFLMKWTASAGAIAIDDLGYIYVAGNNSLEKFTNAGASIAKWGSAGAGESQFNGIYGLTVDASGSIYVADLDNYRIQKFSQKNVTPPTLGTIKISVNASNPSASNIIASEGAGDEVSGVTLLVSNVKAEKSDIKITGVKASILKTGIGTANVATAYLYDGPNLVGSTVINSTTSLVNFSDLNIIVGKDITKVLTLRVDIKNANGLASIFTASITGADIMAEDSNANTVTSTGSAIGANISVWTLLHLVAVTPSVPIVDDGITSTTTVATTFTLTAKEVNLIPIISTTTVTTSDFTAVPVSINP